MFRIGAVSQQGAQHASVRREMREFDTNQLAQALFQSARVLESLLDLGLHRVTGTPVEVHYDSVLGREVVVRRSRGHTGLFRNVPHRSRLEPALTKRTQGGANDPRAGLFALRSGF